jgi:hypothetical protein
VESADKEYQRLHRLHLTLISTVASLPLPLLMLALEEIRMVIVTCPQRTIVGLPAEDEPKTTRKRQNEWWSELVKALLSEILEKVGDREKGEGMRWWYEHREELMIGDGKATLAQAAQVKSKDMSKESEATVKSRI